MSLGPEGFSLDLLSCPRGRPEERRPLASNLFQDTGPGEQRGRSPRPMLQTPQLRLFLLSSLSGFYRQLLVGDINCPDYFIDNFDVTEHRRNYPPVQNVKSEKKQVLRRDPTVPSHCGGSGPRHQQFCLFS